MRTILGKSGEIIVVTKREDVKGDLVTESMSLLGCIQSALIGSGNPADLDRYRKALKDLSLELYERSLESV